jgi:hypothetical protein
MKSGEKVAENSASIRARKKTVYFRDPLVVTFIKSPNGNSVALNRFVSNFRI